MDHWLTYLAAGFVAQLIDGALGMAYGVTASSFLLGSGLPPATVSATVHMAETFSSGASAISHKYFGNIDRALFRRLVLPGVAGAMVGAYALASLPGERLRPLVAGYLFLMGGLVFVKAFRQVPPVSIAAHVRPLGFFGALIDSLGGGGWGPIVASTLLARGGAVRTTVGTINAVEFFVTLASSITFLLVIGLSSWRVVLGLGIGGAIAAPIGAWVCRHVPHRPMLAVIGMLIMALSGHTLWWVFSR